jgi:predicted Zn finger-like uncharacterized protein
MIEIQCTSCHTRYRIDERVLPADSPTFKCSRCGHVFTSDPVVAKKVVAEPASRPATPRASTPRANLKPEVEEPASAPAETPVEAPKTYASEEQASPAKSPLADDAKPAPIKPYIRNQRPTVFDRTPEAPPTKPPVEPAATIDTEAVARMRSSMEPVKSSTAAQPLVRGPEVQKSVARPSPPEQDKTLERINPADDEGENLEFDFSDETDRELDPEPADDQAPATPERWSVGDDSPETPAPRTGAFGPDEPDPELSRGEPAPIGRGTIPQYAASAAMQHAPLPDETAFIERTQLHTARSVIGLFFVVAVFFAVATGVICVIPSASASLLRKVPLIGTEFEQPTPLENLVGVSDVQSSYQTLKGGHAGLVVTGVVKNSSSVPLHTVQVGVHLLDTDQHEVASSAVYCGTTLSPRMIGEMTPHELEFLQKLDPQKAFVLAPEHSAPFLMVFIDPPREVRHLAVAVSKALPPATAPTGQTNAGL